MYEPRIMDSVRGTDLLVGVLWVHLQCRFCGFLVGLNHEGLLLSWSLTHMSMWGGGGGGWCNQ